MGDAEGPYSFAPLLAAALGLAVCVVLRNDACHCRPGCLE